MLFNSIDFAFFLPIVFVFYWFVVNKSTKMQNVLLLLSSYVFYGWWDWRFLALIAFSSVVDFIVGIYLNKETGSLKRKILVCTSIAVNIGLLGVFKYYNFFVQGFVDAFSILGHEFHFQTLNVILPVGISFYTFQTLSYTIDVYRKKLTATRDFVSFFAYVAFFPQLVAGPIERAVNLLPQFGVQRTFDANKSADGLRQILWGLFKKIVIADNCAPYVDAIFANAGDHSGSVLFIGVFLFAFQIYGDFSGYSDIAIGSARLFGFNLMQNFAFPYFSRDIAEFWRRWHISLSSWFRDYLYIPIGGSRGGKWTVTRNILVIFVISGFWHGANWTFLFWGLINGLYFLPLLFLKRNRKYLDTVAENSIFPTLREIVQISTTFFMTLLAWIFFRAQDMGHAISFLKGILSTSLFSMPEVQPVQVLILIALLVAVEWIQRKKEHALKIEEIKTRSIRWLVYLAISLSIIFLGGEQQEFIYFQF